MLTINRAGDNGQNVTYYSHGSFLSDNQKKALHQCRQRALGYGKFTAGALAVGLVVGMEKISALKGLAKKAHPLAIGFGVYFLGYWAFGGFYSSLYSSSMTRIIESQGAIPLWKNPSNVINLDRAYFSLDDSRNNEPNIIHDGLTVNNVGRLFPDLIIGKVPTEKPHYPTESHDHHHH